MIGKYINIKAFLISFAVGVLYIYLTEDYKKVIVVYPTPINIGKKVYVDKGDNCFTYKLAEGKCPMDPTQYISVGASY